MTKRKLTAFSLGLATAVMLLNEQAAYSSETIAELLRTDDAARKAAPLPSAPTSSLPAANETIWDLLRSPEFTKPAKSAVSPSIDLAAPLANETLWDLLRIPGSGSGIAAAPNLPFAGANAPAYETIWDLLRAAGPVTRAAALPPPSGTVWDLLRKSGSANNTAALPPPTQTIWDLLRFGRPMQLASSGAPGVLQPDPGTIWDLLHPDDSANLPPPGTPGAMTLADAVRGGQPGIDPKTGAPIALASAKPRGGIPGFFDSMGQTFRKVGKALNSDIKVNGQKSIGFHVENVSGSGETYQSDTYYGRRGIGGAYDNTDLTIQGKIAGLINFETRYSNSLYGNPYDNRLSLNYDSKHLKVDAGDITGTIQGNSLIDFTRTLKGIQVAGDVLRGVRLTALMSQTKAEAHTQVLPGGNGPGPYYVYVGQIVDGSDHVRINNHDVPRDEYTLDPYTGQLQFKVGTIIHPEDVIAVTFESYGYNQSAGTLTGYRADINLIKGARMGLSYLAQMAPSSGSSLSSKTDQFQGYGDVTTPYTLDFPVDLIILTKDSKGQPLTWQSKYPMTVTVNGIPQVWKSDYIVDPVLPNRVFFSHPIPSTNLVRITYVPRVDNQAPGNRNVMGLDTYLPLGTLGNITAEMATSKLDLSGTNIKGAAWQIRGDMKFMKDRLHWNWNLRDINPNFTSIESPGFRRNEAGLTMGFDYLASSALKLNFNVEQSKRPSYDYSSLGSGGSSQYAGTSGRDDFAQMNFGVNWQLGKAGQLTLQHNSMDTKLASGGKTTFLSDALNFSYKFKSLAMNMMFGRNDNASAGSLTGSGSTTTTTTANKYNSNSLTQRLDLNWNASESLSFAVVMANSKLAGSQGPGSNAQDMQLTAQIKPLRAMRLTLGYTMQNSGSTSYLGNQFGTTTPTTTPTTPANSNTSGNLLQTRQSLGNGTGSGYGNIGYGSGFGFGSGFGGSNYGSYYGGGYNSGLGGFGNYSGGLVNSASSGFGITSFGGNSKGLNMSLNYQPWQKLSLDFTWNQSSSAGDYLFNSKRNDLGMNLTYNAGERLTLSTALSTQKVSYIGSAGGTNSNLMMFNIQSRPFGKLRTNLNYSLMRTNSSGSLTTGGTTGLPGGLGSGYGNGYSGLGGTNLNSMSVRLEYPILRNNSLYYQFDNSTSSGYLAAIQRTTTFGLLFDLTHNMAFSLGWRIQEHISTDTSLSSGGTNFSYKASSLDADLNLHF